MLSDPVLLPSQEHSAELSNVRKALLTLPTEQAEVLHLVGVLGFTYADAAEVLGVPTGTVMSRLSRARAALRDRMEVPSMANRHTCEWLEVTMDPADRISEEEINRLLDGELSPAQRADVQARLALDPELAAKVFGEAQRMDAFRRAQPERLFPPRASLDRARQLEGAFRRRRMFAALRMQVAAVLLVGLGWAANSLIEPLRPEGKRSTRTSSWLLARLCAWPS